MLDPTICPELPAQSVSVKEWVQASVCGEEPVPRWDPESAGGNGEIGMLGRSGSGPSLKPIQRNKVTTKD